MKRAELGLVYMVITVVAFSVLFLGFMVLRGYDETQEKVKLVNFESSLQRFIDSQRAENAGTTREETLAVPTNVEKVCFVDKNQQFNELVDNDLTRDTRIYSSHNLFLSPTEKYIPSKVENIVLDGGDNPLCVKAVNGKVRLKLESTGTSTLVLAANENEREVECISVLYSGEPEQSLDIVFLPSGYDDIEDFSSRVEEYVDSFKYIKPFLSNMDKVNFYRIDEFRDLGCEIHPYGGGSFLLCDDWSAKNLASQCPVDQVFVIADINGFVDFVRGVRSSAKGNMASINAADDDLIFMHELGHTFGGLADEYTDDDVQNFDEGMYANCDTGPCEEWRELAGVGCYQGCTYSSLFRPTDDSIMNSARVDYYGPVSESAITERLEAYED